MQTIGQAGEQTLCTVGLVGYAGVMDSLTRVWEDVPENFRLMLIGFNVDEWDPNMPFAI